MTEQKMNYYNIQIPQTVRFFKEETSIRLLELPSKKTDIGRIVRCTVWPEVEDYRLVKTELGCSYEGQRLTGRLLVVTVKLNITVTYAAVTSDEALHSVEFESYKTMSVVLPQEEGGSDIDRMVELKQLHVMPYMEALYNRKINARTIELHGLVLVDVNFR